MHEFRDAMREVAPRASLDCFWRRFAAEWPEVVEASRLNGASARQHAGILLWELLPRELAQRCGVAQCSEFAFGERPLSVADSVGMSSPTKKCLPVLTLEVFDAFAAVLDISRGNAKDLFEQIVAAAVALGRQPAAEHDDVLTGCTSSSNEKEAQEIDIEDFLEQMALCSDNPLQMASARRLKGETRAGTQLSSAAVVPLKEVVEQLMAPSKAAMCALKAQLAPPKLEPVRPQGKVASRCRLRYRKLPQPPWQSLGQSFSGVAPTAASTQVC